MKTGFCQSILPWTSERKYIDADDTVVYTVLIGYKLDVP